MNGRRALRRLRALHRLVVLLVLTGGIGGALASAEGLRAHAEALVEGGEAPAPATRDAGDPEGCRLKRRVVRVRMSARRWPHIVDHIRDVRESRKYPRAWHLDRAGADENREESLRGIPTRKGYDRDELPIAASREGGRGADVRYVKSSENRSAGAYMGERLSRWCSGQRFMLVPAR